MFPSEIGKVSALPVRRKEEEMKNNKLCLRFIIPVQQQLTRWDSQEDKPLPVRQGERIASLVKAELERDLQGVTSEVRSEVAFGQPNRHLKLVIDQGRELLEGYDLETVTASIMEKVYGKKVQFRGTEHSEDSLH